MVLIIVMFATLNQGSNVATNYFLAYWSNHVDDHPSSYFLKIYASLAVANILFLTCGNIVRAWAGVQAAKKLHELLLFCVMKSRLSFFLTTPTGQITNRFAQDVYTVRAWC